MPIGGARVGAGRPKGSMNKATADVRKAAQKYTPRALNTLATIMEQSESDAARVSAAKELLDRAHGKSTQVIAGDPDGEPIHTKVTVELVRPKG